MNSKIAYRDEITGLRGICVLLVLFFHLEIPYFNGGYIGVDVFFVISGYLISHLIIKDLSSGQFKLIDFYCRRIKRLAPTLMVVVLGCLISGYFISMPGDLKELAVSTQYLIVFISNYYFLDNTGYFNAPSMVMPLLHTWSLSIEEQYYLIVPLLLITIYKINLNLQKLFLGLMFIFFSSLIISIFYTSFGYQKEAFYLLSSRSWELTLGALIAIYKKSQLINKAKNSTTSRLANSIGIFLILGSSILFNKETPFPGFYALVPALGASLILLFTLDQQDNFPPLKNLFIKYIGNISYPLYLVHWPIIAFYKQYNGQVRLENNETLLIILISLLASMLIHHCIEKPIRININFKPIFVFLYYSFSQILLLLFSQLIINSNGIDARIPLSLRGTSSLAEMWEWDCKQTIIFDGRPENCVLGANWTTSKNRAVLWGDSNAMMLFPMLHEYLQKNNISMVFFPNCSVVQEDIYSTVSLPNRSTCLNYRRNAISFINDSSNNIKVVLLASAWPSWSQTLISSEGGVYNEESGIELLIKGLKNTIDIIQNKDRFIFLLSDIPKWGIDPISCALSRMTTLLRKKCEYEIDSLDMSYFYKYQKLAHDALRALHNYNNLFVLSPEDAMCKNNKCMTIINGEFIYRDGGHLRRNLNQKTNEELGKLFKFNTIFESFNRHQPQ